MCKSWFTEILKSSEQVRQELQLGQDRYPKDDNTHANKHLSAEFSTEASAS